MENMKDLAPTLTAQALWTPTWSEIDWVVVVLLPGGNKVLENSLSNSRHSKNCPDNLESDKRLAAVPLRYSYQDISWYLQLDTTLLWLTP